MFISLLSGIYEQKMVISDLNFLRLDLRIGKLGSATKKFFTGVSFCQDWFVTCTLDYGHNSMTQTLSSLSIPETRLT
jgi:hypothetical protein